MIVVPYPNAPSPTHIPAFSVLCLSCHRSSYTSLSSHISPLSHSLSSAMLIRPSPRWALCPPLTPIIRPSRRCPSLVTLPMLGPFPLSSPNATCTPPCRASRPSHPWLRRSGLLHLGVPRTLVDYILSGVHLGLARTPPRLALPNYPSLVDHADATATEFDRLVTMGRLEGPLRHTPHCVSPQGVIVKRRPDGTLKVRITFDATASGLNDTLHLPSITLPSIDQVITSLRPDSVLTVFDLQDGFLHVPVHTAEVDLLGCRHPVTHQFYRYRYLPFGVASCPLLFCTVMNIIAYLLQQQDSSTSLFLYIDDILAIAPSHPHAVTFQQHFRQTCASIGIRVNWAKLEGPATRVKYLGFILDTSALTISLPAAKHAAIVALVSSTRQHTTAPAGQLASLAGKLVHISRVVPHGKMHLRPLWDLMTPTTTRTSLVSLSADLHATLDWWDVALRNNTPRRLWITSSGTLSLWNPSIFIVEDIDSSVAVLFTDARTNNVTASWGAAFGTHTASGCFTQPHASWPIHALELLAVLEGLTAFPSIRDQRVLVCVDNMAALLAINKRTPGDPRLRAALHDLARLEALRGIELIAWLLPGSINTAADLASRDNVADVSLVISPAYATLLPRNLHLVAAEPHRRLHPPLLLPTCLASLPPWKRLVTPRCPLFPADCITARYTSGRTKHPRTAWLLIPSSAH